MENEGTKPITRIDLETQPNTVGAMVMVDQYYEGWTFTTPVDVYETQPGPIASLLAQYEKQGFTVWMCASNRGRALRGETTRMDFIQVGETWEVRKFPYGWDIKTHPITVEQKAPNFDLEAALVWCKRNYWQIRRWPGGARAWKGPILPIRNKSDILYLRRKVNDQIMAGHIDNRNQFNLALDF